MEKDKTAHPADPPRQDVDDLIFFDQTEIGVSQR